MEKKKLKRYIILIRAMMYTTYAAMVAAGFLIFVRDIVNMIYASYACGAVRYLMVTTVTTFRYMMRKSNYFEDDEFLKREMKTLGILVNIAFCSNFLFAMPVFFLDMGGSVYSFVVYCIMLSVHFYSVITFGKTAKYMRQNNYF